MDRLLCRFFTAELENRFSTQLPPKKGKDFTFSCKSEIWVLKCKSSFSIERTLVKGAVSRNSAKLGSYKMPVKLREA